MAASCGRRGRMTGPSAVRAHVEFRRSPAEGRGLLHDSYELRGRDGLLICRVSRHRAEEGIAAGQLVLRDGKHGAYLSAAGPAAVSLQDRTKHQGSGRTWLGPREPGAGAP